MYLFFPCFFKYEGRDLINIGLCCVLPVPELYLSEPGSKIEVVNEEIGLGG